MAETRKRVGFLGRFEIIECNPFSLVTNHLSILTWLNFLTENLEANSLRKESYPGVNQLGYWRTCCTNWIVELSFGKQIRRKRKVENDIRRFHCGESKLAQFFRSIMSNELQRNIAIQRWLTLLRSARRSKIWQNPATKHRSLIPEMTRKMKIMKRNCFKNFHL